MKWIVIWVFMVCKPCEKIVRSGPCYEPTKEQHFLMFENKEEAVRFEFEKVMDGATTHIYALTETEGTLEIGEKHLFLNAIEKLMDDDECLDKNGIKDGRFMRVYETIEKLKDGTLEFYKP